MTDLTYLNLITSAWRKKPDFVATVAFCVSPMVQIQNLLTAMIPLFDLDFAVGNQLDIIGQWIGVTRNIAVPIAGVYFSWDSTIAKGWDFGSWAPGISPANVTALPDDAYRFLLKAKAAANKWDGTTTQAYAIWSALLASTGTTVVIQDNQNMTFELILNGGIIDTLTLALISGGYVPLKPEAVAMTVTYNP